MTILIDFHVHFHPAFVAQKFLDHAWRNFGRAVDGLVDEEQEPRVCCLVFTEMADADDLGRISRETATGSGIDWNIRDCGDAGEVVALNEEGARILIIPGRQIATGEGLEVLTLREGLRVGDGLPFEETVDRAVEQGSLPIIPWGFGKWWLRRAAILDQFFQGSNLDRNFLVADSGLRPSGSHDNRFLQGCRSSGVPVLAGSDPLPLAWHHRRAGSYGTVLDCQMDWDAPATSIRDSLRALRGQPSLFGDRLGWLQCSRDQVAVRLPAGRSR